ncbi:MAG: hypothetical protein U9Q69_02610 [Nanoarchaeota archaeon]|nr:hypothetical protein [Nanoarchaeota archaeon]
MVHKRYIKRGDKVYGPYLYKSVRDNDGKVRNVYLGQAKDKPQTWKILVFFLIAFILFCGAFREYSMTGASVVTLQKNGVINNLGRVLFKDGDSYKLNIVDGNNFVHISGIEDPPLKINLEVNKPQEKIIKSDVVFVDNLNIKIANIILEKKGPIDAIFYCANYDALTKTCEDWVKTDIPFEDNENTVSFNVDHFSAYGAGAYTNISIWDDTDSGSKYSNRTQNKEGVPYKGVGSYVVNFYANYSNTSFGPIIGNCSIRFDYTGSYTPFSQMNYSATTKLYEFNTSFDRWGTFTFEVNCTNSTHETLNLTDSFVISNTAPYQLLGSGSTAPSQSCIEDSACLYNLSANFSDDDSNDLPLSNFAIFNASSTEFNDCLSIDSTTGEVTVECTSSSLAGSHYFTATVTDGGALTSSSVKVPYEISAVNDYPTITSSLTPTCTEDSLCSFYVNANDEENGSISSGSGTGFGLLFFGDNSTLFDINDTNGSISFLPTNAEVGVHVIEINVTDSNDPNATTSSNLVLTVNQQNDPPNLFYACDNELEQAEDVFFSCHLNTSDIDVGDTHTYSANYSWFNFSCAGVSVSNGNTSCLVNFIPQDNSVYAHWINITVTDSGGLKDSVLINFSVTNVEDLPKFNNFSDNFSAYVNATFTLNMSATDDDVYTQFGETLYYYDNTSLFDINFNNGMIIFTPNATVVGTHWVNISVNDSSLNVNSTVLNFTVFANALPLYTGLFNFNITDGDEFILNMSKNTSDADGDSFTFTDNTTLFNINETTGILNFTANDSYVGENWVKINITDSKGAVNYFNLNFTIYNVNDTPILDFILNYSTNEGQELTFTVTADDEDLAIPGTSEYLRFSDNSSLFNINPVTGVVCFTPGATSNGTYRINITVNDTSGLMDSQVFVINITDAAFPPVLEYVCDNERNATEDVPFSCIINATDKDAGSYLWFRANYSFFQLNESNISTVNDVATTIVNFTPVQDDVGNYSINITVYDNTYEVVSIVIYFNISSVNDPPNLTYIEPQELTVNAAYTYTVIATDEENDNITYHDNTSLFEINLTTGKISFTPNALDEGTHWVNISVNDSLNQFDSQIVNFSIYTDTAPACTIFLHDILGNHIPPKHFNATENTSIGKFTVTCADPPSEIFSYNWYINGTLNKSAANGVAYASTWNYNISFYEAGEINITLVLNDSNNLEVRYYWNVTIFDLNAPPFMYSDIPNITDGWDQDEDRGINLSTYFYDIDDENLTYSWFEYSLKETFTNMSNITVGDSWLNDSGDWGIVNISNNLKYVQLDNSDAFYSIYKSKNYTDITEYKVKLRFLTTGSAGLCIQSIGSCLYGQQIFLNASNNKTYWRNVTAGSSTQTNATYPFNITLNSDYWIKVKHKTNNTLVYVSSNDQTYNFAYNISYPSLRKDLSLGLLSINSKTYYDDIIIKDPDVSNITITVDEDIDNMTFTPLPNFFGEVPLVVVANDGNHSRESNEFYLIIDEVSRPAPITITQTQMSSSSQTIIKKPALEIIVPSFLTLSPLAKTLVPVVLNNTGELNLNIIELLAQTNATELALVLSESDFSMLNIGESRTIELEITAGILTPDRYTILLDGYVQSPKLHEQAKIVVDVREKDAALKTQLKEQIQFTRDLFLQNPECVELNELLDQAQQLYALKQYKQGLELVHQANEGCKNFIAEEKKKRTPGDVVFKAKNFLFENWKAIILELSALIFAILLIMYYFKRRRFSKPL